MSRRASIEHKLNEGLRPRHLEVLDESHRHNVPPGSESHFRVVVVADAFDGHGLLARHRMIHALLSEELAGAVHALALHTYTAADWDAKQGHAPSSPPCLGGGRGAAEPRG